MIFLDIFNISGVLKNHAAKLFPCEVMSLFAERYPILCGFEIRYNSTSNKLTVHWKCDEEVSLARRQCAAMMNRIDEQESTLISNEVPVQQIVYIVRNGTNEEDQNDTLGMLCTNRNDAYYHCQTALRNPSALLENALLYDVHAKDGRDIDTIKRMLSACASEIDWDEFKQQLLKPF
jgi:hypothetical protein